MGRQVKWEQIRGLEHLLSSAELSQREAERGRGLPSPKCAPPNIEAPRDAKEVRPLLCTQLTATQKALKSESHWVWCNNTTPPPQR